MMMINPPDVLGKEKGLLEQWQFYEGANTIVMCLMEETDVQ